jgi:nucleoside-diphosphate kinase|tara:strand:- start:1935 stop:2333 length:399 start_codon:yes stop_codon:yes gene_type:complete
MEKTLVIIKPDAIEKKCIGKIIDRFETEGFEIVQTEMMALSDDMLNEHYSHLTDKPFFPEIVEFMQSLPVVVLTIQAENAVVRVRDIVGVTDPDEADDNTLRKQFGTDVMKNVIHASDSVENAKAEIIRFFG